MKHGLPPLLAISSGLAASPSDVCGWAIRLADRGVSWLQIREKGRSDRELLNTLEEVVRCLGNRASLMVNGRCDLAGLAGAAGVHLPSDGLPVAMARHLLGADGLVGCSTHSVAEVEAAARDGADYVLFGPVYEPLSKTARGPIAGLERLARAASVPVPVYALGGVTIERLSEIAETGAAGVAGITLFQEPDQVDEVVRSSRLLFKTGNRWVFEA